MLEHDAHELGLTLEGIRQWQPPKREPAKGEPQKTRKTRKKKGEAEVEE
jgi:hypothetical protein